MFFLSLTQSSYSLRLPSCSECATLLSDTTQKDGLSDRARRRPRLHPPPPRPSLGAAYLRVRATVRQPDGRVGSNHIMLAALEQEDRKLIGLLTSAPPQTGAGSTKTAGAAPNQASPAAAGAGPRQKPPRVCPCGPAPWSRGT